MKRLWGFLLAFLVWAGVATAQVPMTHAGVGTPSVAQFTPVSAAHVTQEMFASNSSIANSPRMVLSFWYRCTIGTTVLSASPTFGCFNAVTFGNWNVSFDAEHNPGFTLVAAESPAAGGTVRYNFNNATGGNLNSGLQTSGGFNSLNSDWHHILIAVDVSCTSNVGANTRCADVEIDGTTVASDLVDQNSGNNWSGTRTIAFAADAFNFNTEVGSGAGSQHATNFDIAEVYLATPSVAPVNSSNALTFSKTLFITAGGKPVDLGTNCANPGLTGLQVCFNSAPGTGWITNAGGAAGAFTQGGTNTFSNKAFAASTAPGEVPDRPWIRWTTTRDWHTTCPETTGATGCTDAANYGNRIVQGDLLCLDLNASMVTNFAVAFTTASTGWSAVANMGQTTNLGGTPMNVQTFCKAAAAGDVTAPGATWAGSPTWKWTPNGTDAWYSSTTWTLTDYGVYGAGNTTPSISASQATATASGSLPCPTLTAPAGKSLHVCSVMTYDWGFIAATVGPSTTGNLLFKLKTGVSGNTPMLFWEKLSASGSTARSAQESGALGNPTFMRAMILNGFFLIPAFVRRRKGANDNSEALQRVA